MYNLDIMENRNEWIDFLIKKAKFNLTTEEKNKFDNDLKIFEEQLKDLDKIDLENVKPISAPFIKYENNLRDDSDVMNLSDEIVSNSSNSKDGYIFLKKENK